MKVETIEATPNPERTICKAARNDYREAGLSEDGFSEIIDPVDGETIPEKKYTLLRHLIKKEHYGPLEHVHASFNIEGMSRVVMAQATRHRLLSWDIQSQRYVDFTEPDYTVPESFTNSEHYTRDDGQVDIEENELKKIKEAYNNSMNRSSNSYEWLVKEGVPKEDARYVLPTGMQVNAVMSGNLRALLHVVNMRSKGNVQSETMDLAQKVEREIKDWVPTVHSIIKKQMPMKLGL